MNNKHILYLILFLGVVLRFTWLGQIPAGFFKDEAAFAYNAYSLWETGKDEFGVSFPLIFRSFEVFLLPMYMYLSAPIIGILGLSEFSARFLSALSGVVALIVIYFTALNIWNKKVALFSVFLLAITPWHLLYSRGVFEGNVALTLFASGFLFLVLFLKTENTKHLIFASLTFALSMYSYHAERAVVPAFGLLVLLFNFKKFWNLRSKLILPILVFVIILIPLLSFTFKTAGVHRAFGVSVFNKEPHGYVQDYSSNIFLNNKVILRSKQITALYLSYFSPRNLFIEGDSERQRSVEKHSVFYPLMFPFLVVGAYLLLKRLNMYNKLLFCWIITAPLPAALTGDPFHTYRSLLLFFPLTLVSGYGINYVYSKVSQKKLFLNIFILLTGLSFIYFSYNYVLVTQATHAREWDYGYKEIFEKLDKYQGNRIVIHDRWTEPYIHMLFFKRFDPRIYHAEVKKIADPNNFYYQDPSEIRPVKVANYEFRLVDWPSERGDKGTIFVFDAKDLPESEFRSDPNIELLDEIKYPDGTIAYRIVRVKN